MTWDDLPTWVAEHPVKWGVVASAGLFFVIGALNGLYGVALIVSPLFGVANWWIWRAGGPGHGWRAALLRRFPPKDHRS